MFWQLWELKQMYEKYKKLQEVLKNIVIRSKEEKNYHHSGADHEIKVLIDITGEMKVRDVTIDAPDELISESVRKILSDLVKAAFEKWQAKAQQVAMENTKEILGFDPNDLAGMMWGMGWMWGMPKLW
jgi:DNA-binding protein YbaB